MGNVDPNAVDPLEDVDVDDGSTLDDRDDGADGDTTIVAGTGEEYVPPTQEEFAKTQRALKRYRLEAKKQREAAQAATTDKDAAAQAAEALTSWQQRAVRSEAKTLFVSAGAQPDKVTRLVKLLDLSDIDLTGSDDDVADSLQEQIDELREEFPELFASTPAPTPPRRPGSVDQGAGNGKPVVRQKSFGERLIDAGAGMQRPKRH